LSPRNGSSPSAPGHFPDYNLPAVLLEEFMTTNTLLLAVLDEGYSKKTWHGPNLKQSLRGVSAKQAAWRPGHGRHNIWEIALHAAYWKYAVRRRLEGGKRGSFILKGSNFFARPENGKAPEAAWSADRAILETEHQRLKKTIRALLKTPQAKKRGPMIYGIAFHDVYHAGQVRLLRRLMES
jgi:hypothetical protein